MIKRKTQRPQILLHAIGLVFSIICLIPFVLVVSASFSNEYALNDLGYSLLPREFDLMAYRYILNEPMKILRSSGVTIVTTAATTALGTLFMAMIAYALARDNCRFRGPLAFYVFFTMLFSGGLVPSYILITQVLDMKNSLAVMILPSLVNAFYVIMIRTFFQKLPGSLFESAKIDGANEFTIFFKIAMPLSVPALATVAFFTAMIKWNDWQTGLLYISNENLEPLQYMLYKIQQNIQSLLIALGQGGGINVDVRSIPGQNLLMATAVVAAGPMLFVFPMFQKYFVAGLTVGGVKG